MAPPDSPFELGELQLAVMRVLWHRREATAAEVHAELGDERTVAITTVSTTLQRLEKRGFVSHRSEGRQFVYLPRVSEPVVRRSMLDTLVRTLFSGDRTAVFGELLSARDLSTGDVEEMRALLDANARRSRSRRR